MKKLLFFALLLIGTIGAKADEITGALKVAADKQTATLHVSLTNDQSYVAFQMDVTLPEGWTVTSAAPVGSSRLDGDGDGTNVGDTKFNLAYNVIGGNKLRVLAYNLANSTIQGTSGEELFTVELTKSDAAPADVTSWTATFSDVLFVTDALVESSMNVSNENSTVTGETASLRGDVNKDGLVNITDVVEVITYINNKEYYSLADVNNDSFVNITDVVEIITIINNK